MSEPNENHAQPLGGVSSEISSAMSSLNMEPSPLKNVLGDHGYLSETDYWAAHSLDHLFAALANLRKVSGKIQQMKILTMELLKSGDISADAADKLFETLDSI